MITPEELASWSALAEAATPGPWHGDCAGRLLDDTPVQIGEIYSVADGKFCKTARTALPRLIEEIRRIEASRAAWERQARIYESERDTHKEARGLADHMRDQIEAADALQSLLARCKAAEAHAEDENEQSARYDVALGEAKTRIGELDEALRAMTGRRDALLDERDALIADNATIMTTNTDLANEVIKMAAENERLREALKPFARACEYMTSDYEHDLDPVTKADRVVIEIGHLRRARAALASKPAESGKDGGA